MAVERLHAGRPRVVPDRFLRSCGVMPNGPWGTSIITPSLAPVEAALDRGTDPAADLRPSRDRDRRGARARGAAGRFPEDDAAALDPGRPDHQAEERGPKLRPPRRTSGSEHRRPAPPRPAQLPRSGQPGRAGDLRLGRRRRRRWRWPARSCGRTAAAGLTILDADASTRAASEAVWFNRAWLAVRSSPGRAAPPRKALEARLQRRRARVPGLGLPAGPAEPPHHRDRAGASRQRAAAAAAHPRMTWQAAPLARQAVEPIPGRLRWELRMAPRPSDRRLALPRGRARAEAARERLAFEELFLYQAALVTRRGRRLGARGHRATAAGAGVGAWLESLPF